MKYIAIISVFLSICLSGCQVQKEVQPTPAAPPAETNSGETENSNPGLEETGQAMAPVLEETINIPQTSQELVSLWGKRVREDFKWYSETGRKNGPVYYLYVTDAKGNPVPNLNCYTRTNWEAELRGVEHLRGTSMKSGLLPVVLSFREAEKNFVELIVVNPNSNETLSVEINLLETGWRYALHTIWEQGTPNQAVDCVEISVLSPDGMPVSGAVVELPNAQSFRFSDLDGKAFFPPDILQGNTEGFTIVVKDYLEGFQEGKNWSETFSADISNSKQYVLMLKETHS